MSARPQPSSKEMFVRRFDTLRPLCALAVVTIGLCATASPADAENLCDPSIQNCRNQHLALIDAENVGIDAGFWFMEDQRYVSHIISRWNAGVPVRLIIDPRANVDYPLNQTSLDAFQ